MSAPDRKDRSRLADVDVRDLGSLLQILVVCGDDEWLTDLTRLVHHRVLIVAPNHICDRDRDD